MPKLVGTNYTPTLLSSKKTGTDRDYMWVRKKLMAEAHGSRTYYQALYDMPEA